MSESDDTFSTSCYDCGRTPASGRLPRHPVIISHDDGLGYEEVPVPLCERCRGQRFGFECPQCGARHTEKDNARYCCRRRPGDAPDCRECGRRMERGSWGWAPETGRTVEWAECPACGIGWGRYTGWHDLDEDTGGDE